MYTEKTKYKKHHIKKISLLLTIAMIFSLVSFTPKSEVHAAPVATVDMSSVSGDVTITRNATDISASTSGGVVATGTAEEGIDITGTTSEYRVSISGQGSGGENINVTLDHLSITTDGPIQLEDSANVKMSLKNENILDSSDDNNIYPGLRVSSPNAISIGGEGKLTAKGYLGAGIGGQGISEGADQVAENGDNITIEGSPSVTAISLAGAGIGGGGVNGDPENPTFGGSENIIIKDNAEVKAHSEKGAGIGGGNFAGDFSGWPKIKEVKGIKIFGDAVVDAQSGNDGAGIGGGYRGTGSDIRISGNAVVDAQSRYSGAGIGGGQGGSGSDIRISGNAVVDAQGGFYGAGIGGGQSGTGSDIRISGNAVVDAKGNGGAGIGGGYESSGSDIEISESAVVDAQGGEGAGIGGGYRGDGKNINILGNTVVDAQGDEGAGIGGGHSALGSDISISGGFVTAMGKYCDDIGNGVWPYESSSNITIAGGSVYANNMGTTPEDGSGNPVYKTTVPAVTTSTNKSLIGNKEIGIPLSSGTYKAKTISSGACEHGDSFPSDASAFVYLPKARYDENISIGEYTKGSADVRETPVSNSNIVYWKDLEVSFWAVDADEISFTTKKAIFDENYGELPTAVKAGYAFTGWFTEEIGGTKVTSNTIVKILGNHNLYGRFEKLPSKFTVTLNTNGGKPLKNSKITVTNGGKYSSLPTPTRTGYNFKGWYTKNSGGTKITKDTKVNLTKNQTLYAQWTAKNYKATFYGNKGNIKKGKKYKSKKLSKSITYDKKYGKMPKAKRKGYKFKGWYTKKKGGKKITSSKKMKYSKNIKLYARWKKK